MFHPCSPSAKYVFSMLLVFAAMVGTGCSEGATGEGSPSDASTFGDQLGSSLGGSEGKGDSENSRGELVDELVELKAEGDLTRVFIQGNANSAAAQLYNGLNGLADLKELGVAPEGAYDGIHREIDPSGDPIIIDRYDAVSCAHAPTYKDRDDAVAYVCTWLAKSVDIKDAFNDGHVGTGFLEFNDPPAEASFMTPSAVIRSTLGEDLSTKTHTQLMQASGDEIWDRFFHCGGRQDFQNFGCRVFFHRFARESMQPLPDLYLEPSPTGDGDMYITDSRSPADSDEAVGGGLKHLVHQILEASNDSPFLKTFDQYRWSAENDMACGETNCTIGGVEFFVKGVGQEMESSYLSVTGPLEENDISFPGYLFLGLAVQSGEASILENGEAYGAGDGRIYCKYIEDAVAEVECTFAYTPKF